ncbi:3-oxoacid CoA-transferase subunit B [Candidatus Acetothermia bacterium]|nr:3-oxoacid CoA-transferase subunit B [Candidatus Acetothermia bacterium]MCI2425905.1 3-oxoacid CoA-transferase subunit B [Candidatus Acetothermia bacterium]MCI2427690.1 3-oxoacid CoA-transferase subunit B [Candidatus Acetothermia bacterium]MCI2428316.1 3-oxoacid CoA-transferase subunit B [Candidatus Acetothermia bacterium]
MKNDNRARREYIARRVAQELKDGDVVNLGIGIPTMVANFVPPEITVIFHSENGFVGIGPSPQVGEEDPDIINAGGQPVTILPGGAFFDSTVAFGIIRGGHLDIAVLGALEVDAQGNLANWAIPGRSGPGMGGAMDLVSGAKRVIVATEHTTKDGRPKIVERCSLPLTGGQIVDLIVSDLGVLEVTPAGLLLKELRPGVTIDELQAKTAAEIRDKP